MCTLRATTDHVPHGRRLLAAIAFSLAALPPPGRAGAQQLGYKLLGSAGIDAGVQSLPGLYVIGRVIQYSANQIRDRGGNVVPIDGLDIDAIGTALGAGFTTKTKHAPYLSFAAGIPLARVNVSSINPAASLSGYGFSDLFVQPLKVGWREARYDVVTAYMVYVPTGKFEPKGAGPGRGYWTNEFSAGGAVYFDTARSGLVSALASYETNTRKRGIDVRRGNMFQVQGGAGMRAAKIVTLGVAGYALWQVGPDRGADIPLALRDERSRVFGLGPELDVMIPKWRVRAELRVEREFGVQSRPRGRVIAFGLSYAAWTKSRQRS